MADPKIEGSLPKNTTYTPQKETSTILNGRVVNSTSKIPRLTSRFNNKMSSTGTVTLSYSYSVNDSENLYK